MKTRNYLFLIAVLTAFLCIPAVGEVELPLLQGLIAQPNPTLAGIEQLYVVIVPPDAEPNKGGLVWKELQAKVESKLKEAGVKIAHAIYISGEKLQALNSIPEIRVNIDMLKLGDSQQYIFHIETSLARKVVLPKRRKLGLKTDVWEAGPVMQAVSAKDMPAKITDVVLEQVEAFIHTWLAANPEGVAPPDVNDINTVSLTIPKQVEKQPLKAAPAKYQYLASKNSKVFHNADCSWAKRISPKNLVSYAGREQAAIEAGKRPCKRCKP